MTPEVERRPELAELVCFDLYAASRAMTAAYRPMLDELGLTYPQYLVLVVVAAPGAEDGVPIRHVARGLRLDHGTLTPLLRRLEAAGLLTRTRSSADERAVLLRVTPAGREVADRFDGVQCRIADTLGLDRDEVVALQGLLRRVNASLDAPA